MSRYRSVLTTLFVSLAWLVGPVAHGETYTQISAGYGHTCAIYGSGGVHCWGQNSLGQLGDGTTTNSAIPVVVAGLTGVTSVAAGFSHTCALAQGVVKCWGYNDAGQLGDGSARTFSSTPVAVVGLAAFFNQPVAVKTGGAFSCAQMLNGLTNASTVRCWGDNGNGQVGSGSTAATVPAPATVSGLTGVTHLSAGFLTACAVTGGTVRCWGRGTSGILGTGAIVPSSNVPAAAAIGVSNATMVAVGASHACAVNGLNGDAWCWGDRQYGQLGDGTIATGSPRATPYFFGASFRPTHIAAGSFSTCGVVNGQAFCWGSNNKSQLGSVGQLTDSATPLAVTGLTGGIATMAVGAQHACALNTIGGGIGCWGDNSFGQRGNPPFTDSTDAGNARVSGTIAPVKCSLDIDGDGQVLATTDAVLMARAALGYTGAALTTSALTANAPRRTPEDLLSYMRLSCGL